MTSLESVTVKSVRLTCFTRHFGLMTVMFEVLQKNPFNLGTLLLFTTVSLAALDFLIIMIRRTIQREINFITNRIAVICWMM